MPILTLFPLSLPIDLWELVWKKMTGILFFVTTLLASSSIVAPAVNAQYLLGLGVNDVTGPVVETNMMGYADLSQTDTGLHMRQYSRAFIIADQSAPSNRIVFINSDIGMGDSGIRRSIIARLSSEFPGVYTDSNIALVATHSHAGVGGYLEHLLPQITALGYVKQTADAIIDGTVAAVRKAHASLAPGKLSVGNATVLDTNINRSPFAYMANPAAERARYQYDQDKDMTVLRFDDNSGKARGLLSFFPVHGTSLYQNNTLVSTDNKGMAAYLYESSVEPDAMPGNTTFVAGFTQANVGDTSPNTLGAYCWNPGQPYHGQECSYETSVCGTTAKDCHGRGPGFRISDFESNHIIGERQFKGAQQIMNKPLQSVTGAVRSVHVYLNMDNHTFTLPNGTTARTCPPAMGYSFAGGTTDGPGTFDFTQGDNSTGNPFWNIVRGAVTPAPNAEQKACHAPKPILLNTGYATFPYEWQPSTVNIQILRAGNFVMLIVPGEATTMSGRRLREAVRAKLISSGVLGNNAYVVLAGPANTYGHYITTREEYSVQRYEGASTLFGPATLEAYIDKYTSLVPFLADQVSGQPTSDAAPPEQTSKAISLQTGVVFDAAPIGKSFGDVLIDVKTTSSYRTGETVLAKFVGANPRNNLRLQRTYLTVDRQVNGVWRQVKSDSHPSTIFRWNRDSTILGTSSVNITWTIENGTPAGTYRLSYYGDSKPLIGSISSFSRSSSSFTIA